MSVSNVERNRKYRRGETYNMRRETLRTMWRDVKRNCRADDPTYTLRVNLWRHYKITLEEYKALVAAQGGLCAICKCAETRSVKGVVARLSVDHNHLTGQRRQLLCSKCNCAIGLVGETIEVLQEMIEYLKRHGGDDARHVPEVVCGTRTVDSSGADSGVECVRD